MGLEKLPTSASWCNVGFSLSQSNKGRHTRKVETGSCSEPPTPSWGSHGLQGGCAAFCRNLAAARHGADVASASKLARPEAASPHPAQSAKSKQMLLAQLFSGIRCCANRLHKHRLWSKQRQPDSVPACAGAAPKRPLSKAHQDPLVLQWGGGHQ